MLKKKYDNDYIFQSPEFIDFTEEEKKLFKLTQTNTILNRDMLDKRDIYLKGVKNEYIDIYGKKRNIIFNNFDIKGNMQHKNKLRVRFSNNIEYSDI